MDDETPETQRPLFAEVDTASNNRADTTPTDTADTADTADTTNDDGLDDELRGALAASDRSDPKTEDLDVLFARHDAWLEANADRLTLDELVASLQQSQDGVPDMPPDPANVTDNDIRSLYRLLWEKHRIIFGSNSYYRVRVEPPRWLKELLGLIDGEPSKRPPRRSIAPAFTLAGRAQVGRISSSQVSDAIFEAFIAPKDKWETSAKGWPQYCYTRNNTRIFIRVRPEVVDPKNSAAERAAMEQIRDELSVRDWDSLTALMAQVLRDGKPDASSFVYADTLLDYRQVKRKKRDGHKGRNAGHQQNMRFEQAASIYRLAHIYAVTETLKIRRLTEKGKGVEYDAVDWNEKIVQLRGGHTRRADDAELSWEYHLGPWFTTFLEKPNRFVAYIWQKVLQYHPTKEQWTKQLAHYLTLELRKNADNGRELRRTVGELLDKAGIPVSERFPNRAKDRLDQALRDVVKDGLFRIEHEGVTLDAAASEIDTWTLPGTKLPPRNWLEAYKKEVVVFRADPETEMHYDSEIRRSKGSAQKAVTGALGEAGK